MVTRISISAEVDAFQRERILRSDWARRYPGAEWMSSLAERLMGHGIAVTTSDMAWSHVLSGYWDAKSIGVVQHVNDPLSESLTAQGATPLVLLAFESPMFVPEFYHTLPTIAPKFNNRVLFGGAFDTFEAKRGSNYGLRFPSYSNEDLGRVKSWHSRRPCVAVVNNKYSVTSAFCNWRYPIDCLRWMNRVCRRPFVTGAHAAYADSQLHDQRLAAILTFGQRGQLDLFGEGWESLRNLPGAWQGRLSTVVKDAHKGRIDWKDKKALIAHYKYSLCLENYAYPGYVTEKIVECFAAGTVPIYLGAPDVQDLIPLSAFIDARCFARWEDLVEHLEVMTEEEALTMIESGREYLHTEEGKLHSYSGFAAFIEDLVMKEIRPLSNPVEECVSVT